MCMQLMGGQKILIEGKITKKLTFIKLKRKIDKYDSCKNSNESKEWVYFLNDENEEKKFTEPFYEGKKSKLKS